MDLKSIKELERWAKEILLYNNDEDLVDAAIFMTKALDCLKNYYYKEVKREKLD